MIVWEHTCVYWPVGYSPVGSSDWLPAGFITLHQRQKQTSWPLTPQVTLLLLFSFPVSFSLYLSGSPTEPSIEPGVGWHWFCLAERGTWNPEKDKAHAAVFEAVGMLKTASQMKHSLQTNPCKLPTFQPKNTFKKASVNHRNVCLTWFLVAEI